MHLYVRCHLVIAEALPGSVFGFVCCGQHARVVDGMPLAQRSYILAELRCKSGVANCVCVALLQALGRRSRLNSSQVHLTCLIRPWPPALCLTRLIAYLACAGSQSVACPSEVGNMCGKGVLDNMWRRPQHLVSIR